MGHYFIKIIPLIIMGTLSNSVWASTKCGTDNMSTTLNITGISKISAGPDLPNGTVLFQGRLQGATNIVKCSRDDPGATTNEAVKVVQIGQVLGTPLADGITFPTSTPGIGVRYWLYGDYLYSQQRDLQTIFNESSVKPDWSAISGFGNLREVTFWLVKTGNVSPGTVDATSFPRIKYQIVNRGPATTSGLPADIMNIAFSGAATIAVPSCQTPDAYRVELGDYEDVALVRDKASSWKDASIRITNCPTFTGYHQNGQDDIWVLPSGVNTVSAKKDAGFPYVPNMLSIKLDSNQGNIDINNGIVGIKTGSGNAEGVAVQIAKGTVGTNQPITLGVPYSQNLPMDGTANITIPLVGRMVTTTGTVKAGEVTALVTYTINYQ